MNTKNTLFALLVASLFMVSVQAGFDNTHDGEDNHREPVQYDSTEVLVETHRNFTVDAQANAYVKLAQPLPENYTVDIYLDGGSGEVLVGDDWNTTDPTDNVTVASSGQLRAELSLPENRTADTEVKVSFIIALDAASDAGGNGGVMDPSFSHRFLVYYYDSNSDSDGDGLPDAWEDQYFGNLDQIGSDDPDMDGWTNREEYEAGTDPTNDASHPSESVVPFVGGGQINDREIGWLILGVFAMVIIVAVTAYFMPGRKEKGAVGWILGIGTGSLIALTVLFGLESVEVTGNGWAFWAYLELTWQQFIVTVLALFGIVGAAGAAFVKLNESDEMPAAIAFIVAAVVVFVLGWLIFGVFDVPLF